MGLEHTIVHKSDHTDKPIDLEKGRVEVSVVFYPGVNTGLEPDPKDFELIEPQEFGDRPYTNRQVIQLQYASLDEAKKAIPAVIKKLQAAHDAERDELGRLREAHVAEEQAREARIAKGER